MYGAYYQAQGVKAKLWFVMGCIRNENDWAFARTYDKTASIMEFFVAPGYEDEFVSLLHHLKDSGYLISFTKKQNRIEMGEKL